MSRKVAVWGRFDELHDGSIKFLRNAKELGDELYIVIIPNKVYEDYKEKMPKNNAEVRKNNLLNLGFVKNVFIDCLKDGLESILDLKPDVFAFGHDQKTKWEEQLKDYLKQKGLSPEYVYLTVYNAGKHGSDLEETLKQ